MGNRVSPKKNSFAFWRPRGFTARDRLNSNRTNKRKFSFSSEKKNSKEVDPLFESAKLGRVREDTPGVQRHLPTDKVIPISVMESGRKRKRGTSTVKPQCTLSHSPQFRTLKKRINLFRILFFRRKRKFSFVGTGLNLSDRGR